jgi:hypothetical protein
MISMTLILPEDLKHFAIELKAVIIFVLDVLPVAVQNPEIPAQVP